MQMPSADTEGSASVRSLLLRGKAEHPALLVPVSRQAIVVHQLASVQLGRVLARENFDGDVRRKPGQSDEAGDMGGGQAFLPGDLGQGNALSAAEPQGRSFDYLG